MESNRIIYFIGTYGKNCEKEKDNAPLRYLSVLQRAGCKVEYVFSEQDNEGFCKQNLEMINKAYVFVNRKYDQKC